MPTPISSASSTCPPMLSSICRIAVTTGGCDGGGVRVAVEGVAGAVVVAGCSRSPRAGGRATLSAGAWSNVGASGNLLRGAVYADDDEDEEDMVGWVGGGVEGMYGICICLSLDK